MTSPHGQFPQGLVSRVPHCAPYGLFTTLVLTRKDRIFWTEYQDLYCDTNHAKLGLLPPLGTRPSGLWAPGTLSPLITSLPSQSHSTISCLGKAFESRKHARENKNEENMETRFPTHSSNLICLEHSSPMFTKQL